MRRHQACERLVEAVYLIEGVVVRQADAQGLAPPDAVVQAESVLAVVTPHPEAETGQLHAQHR